MTTFADVHRVVSLHQPWASLIAMGVKTIETRSWPTRWRGLILIHAAASLPRRLRKGDPVRIGEYHIERDDAGLLMRSERIAWPYRLPLGEIVAAAVVEDCVPMLGVDDPPGRDAHVTEARHVPGRWCLFTPTMATHTIGREVGTHESWEFRDLTGDVPYGDYQPGRWAWILGNVRRFNRDGCAACVGHGLIGPPAGYHAAPGEDDWIHCHACDGTGKGRGPIPVRGKQGLWKWEP